MYYNTAACLDSRPVIFQRRLTAEGLPPLLYSPIAPQYEKSSRFPPIDTWGFEAPHDTLRFCRATRPVEQFSLTTS